MIRSQTCCALDAVSMVYSTRAGLFVDIKMRKMIIKIGGDVSTEVAAE